MALRLEFGGCNIRQRIFAVLETAVAPFTLNVRCEDASDFELVANADDEQHVADLIRLLEKILPDSEARLHVGLTVDNPDGRSRAELSACGFHLHNRGPDGVAGYISWKTGNGRQQKCQFSPQEWAIVKELWRNTGRTLSTAQMAETIGIENAVVRSTLQRLRGRLEKAGIGELLENFPRKGYVFTRPVDFDEKKML